MTKETLPNVNNNNTFLVVVYVCLKNKLPFIVGLKQKVVVYVCLRKRIVVDHVRSFLWLSFTFENCFFVVSLCFMFFVNCECSTPEIH